ncbi:HPP family protein [Rubritalea spongiae]|uniref:HPP family protein n=1 Tax=Rubritalea spongiae TaxID=430797 RepID=A0ABW5E3I7_9BACT
MKGYLNRMKSTGACPPRLPLQKIIWSWIGAFLGILLISAVCESIEPMGVSSLFLIGSFGASAVLVYGAPLAEFSQPRNLIGGHVISAIVGVSVYMLIGDESIFAAPAAVSFAIMIMHWTRTLHPPGGATALIAVIGGEKIHALGYSYVLAPVLIGSLAMLVIALFVNNMSRNPKRHYPVYWM